MQVASARAWFGFGVGLGLGLGSGLELGLGSGLGLGLGLGSALGLGLQQRAPRLDRGVLLKELVHIVEDAATHLVAHLRVKGHVRRDLRVVVDVRRDEVGHP